MALLSGHEFLKWVWKAFGEHVKERMSAKRKS